MKNKKPPTKYQVRVINYVQDLKDVMSQEDVDEKYFNPASPYYSEPDPNTQMGWLYQELIKAEKSNDELKIKELTMRGLWEIENMLEKMGKNCK